MIQASLLFLFFSFIFYFFFLFYSSIFYLYVNLKCMPDGATLRQHWRISTCQHFSQLLYCGSAWRGQPWWRAFFRRDDRGSGLVSISFPLSVHVEFSNVRIWSGEYSPHRHLNDAESHPPDSVHPGCFSRESDRFVHQVSRWSSQTSRRRKDLMRWFFDASGITETTCVLLFSSALGRWVDRNPRLYTLFLTIAVNRAAIVVSCLLWFSILSSDVPAQKNALFSLVLILGMVEKNSRMTNILSMERDWIPTLASSIPGAQFNLTYLNTMMRRIDIFCKFIAPLAISTFISAIAPVKIAIVVVAMISMFSFVPECWCVRKVYSQSSRLQMPNEDKGVNASSASSAWNERLGSKLWSSIDTHVRSLRYYFKSPVWVPSLGIAVLHASVLTYSATFITYLLNAGFPLGMLTVAKAIGSIFEIGSTFVFLWAVNALSKANVSSELQPMEEDGDAREPEDQNSMLQNAIAWNPNTGVVIVGLWGICGLVLNLVRYIFLLSSQYVEKTERFSRFP